LALNSALYCFRFLIRSSIGTAAILHLNHLSSFRGTFQDTQSNRLLTP
jgi:hypothetical protein